MERKIKKEITLEWQTLGSDGETIKAVIVNKKLISVHMFNKCGYKQWDMPQSPVGAEDFCRAFLPILRELLDELDKIHAIPDEDGNSSGG